MTTGGDQVRPRFENVWVDDDKCYKVTIDLGGVRKVMCDNKVVDSLRMKTKDGGVIAFRRSGNTADLVVTWTAYAPPTDETCTCQFDFNTFDLRPP